MKSGWYRSVNGIERMKKRSSKVWVRIVQGLPLAGAVGVAFSPLTRLEQQFVVLIVLVWIQVFFLAECFLISH